jgi:hypothetical protein
MIPFSPHSLDWFWPGAGRGSFAVSDGSASVMLLLVGFGFSCLMILELLPTNFWLAFLGLALAAVGGSMALVRCGEI